MPLKKIFVRYDLTDVQRKILSVMDEERPLSASEIIGRLSQQGLQVTGQALAKDMMTLAKQRYVDVDEGNGERTWVKVRDEPLAVEYVDAKVYMGEADSRVDYLWKFFVNYVENHKEDCDEFARAYTRATKAKQEAKKTEQEARKRMKEIQRRQSDTRSGV